jgi:hypothetical protein
MKEHKMKITYHKNPLYSTVELDEQDKKELWLKIKLEEMEERLFDVHFNLQEGEHFDLESARNSADPEYYCTDEKSPIDKRCDQLLEHYITELQSSHCGDCTCVACSCSKCHAESLLGINTTPGLEKHAASKINGAFGKDNVKSIDEAIDYLANYEINPDHYTSEAWKKLGGHEQYVPRWMAEAKFAHDWLVNYKNEHFKDSN